MPWTQTANIRGASGVPGASGPPGATGPAGPTGATGASGGTGGTGGPGTTSWNDISDKPGAILNYKGTWNASTNSSPSLSDGTGSGGDVYRVSVGGSRNLGSGSISWEVGDYAIYSPVTSSWEKADTTDAVSSVAGRTGAVTITTADLGITGTPSASTFLRGDNTWAPGPIGATGASGSIGATGSSGPTGASGIPGVNYNRVIQTLTSPTTLGASGSTDYVTFLSSTSTDANFNKTVAVLHFDGTNNSTSPITDNSFISTNWIVSGDAKLSTSVKKFGTASLSLDGTGDYVSPTASASNYAFGTNPFTIEMWIYATAVASRGIDIIYDGRAGAATGDYPTIYLNNGQIFYYASGSNRITGNTLSINTWYHIAVCRSGTSTRLFVDGTQQGSTWTDSTNYLNPTGGPVIGAGNDDGGKGSNAFVGYIDDVRIYNNYAAYTANFTAPSAAHPDLTIGVPTLPTASGNLGRYSFRNISGAAIVVGASGSQTINGATGGLSLASGASTELMSDGSGWYSF